MVKGTTPTQLCSFLEKQQQMTKNQLLSTETTVPQSGVLSARRPTVAGDYREPNAGSTTSK
jgi:hypothetical protein